MTTVFVIHGTGGTPEGNWFPWLKKELEKLGCQVFVPRFPTPQGQNLRSWLKVFEKYKLDFNENTIVVGHSLGPAFLLNVLEKTNKPIKAAFFVAGFTGRLDQVHFDTLNNSFADKSFDWEKIKQNCQHFEVIHSDNDPYVPLAKGEELAKHLNAKFIVLKNAGHINKESGYVTFELLLAKIKEELSH